MPDSHAAFNVISAKWILTRSLTGETVEQSLRDVFATAHETAGLAGELATQDVAVLRLLLAVLRRSHLDLRSGAAWADLWERGRFAGPEIDRYLGEHRDRFDLLSLEAPFYQVAELTTAKGEMTDLSRVIADVPAGHPFFTGRSGRALRSMSLGEAARWVVHCQAFDPSGIKSGAVGDDRVRGGKGYPIGVAWCGWLGIVVVEGATLFETLMLNLPVGSRTPQSEADLPAWERPPLTAAVRDGSAEPSGPVDLLTWQSRRIRLEHDGENVTGVLISNGDPLHPRNRQSHEFMTTWRLSEAQMKAQQTTAPIFMPRAHQPDRAVWRGLESLLAFTNVSTRTQAGGWLEWLAELREKDLIDPSHPVRLRTVGMQYGSQSAVTEEVIDDRLVLRLAVLTDRHLKAQAVDAVAAADQAVRALTQLASDIVLAAGGDRDLAATARSSARIEGYWSLDDPYRRWVTSLGPETPRGEAVIAWQREVRRVIDGLGRDLLGDASSAAWAGRPASPEASRPVNAATAANWFHLNLRKALPAAYPKQAQEAS